MRTVGVNEFGFYFSQLCRPLPCVPAHSGGGPARSTSKTSLGSTLERETEPVKSSTNTGSKWNVVRRFVVLNFEICVYSTCLALSKHHVNLLLQRKFIIYYRKFIIYMMFPQS